MIEDPDSPIIIDIVLQKLRSGASVFLRYLGDTDRLSNISWDTAQIGDTGCFAEVCNTQDGYFERFLPPAKLMKATFKKTGTDTWLLDVPDKDHPSNQPVTEETHPDDPIIIDILQTKLDAGQEVRLDDCGGGPHTILTSIVRKEPMRWRPDDTPNYSFFEKNIPGQFKSQSQTLLHIDQVTAGKLTKRDGYWLFTFNIPQYNVDEAYEPAEADDPIIVDLVRAKLANGEMVIVNNPIDHIYGVILSIEPYAGNELLAKSMAEAGTRAYMIEYHKIERGQIRSQRSVDIVKSPDLEKATLKKAEARKWVLTWMPVYDDQPMKFS
jgi:hypothetical protein